MKNKYLVIIIGVLVIAGGLFYWFEYRPSQIRSECGKKISPAAVTSSKAQAEQSKIDYETEYTNCLHESGL